MPNPDPHIDFMLPGWVTTPSARHTCFLSIASANSRRWNPRNLEHPWYEPWAQILHALVADIPSLAVAPQSYLWYYRRPLPGDHHIDSPSAHDEDDLLDWEAGNTTFDSITSIHVGSHRNKYQLVDFAITRKVSRNRTAPVASSARTPDTQFYLSRKVEYLGIPVLCELKRGTPRTSDFLASLQNVRRNLFDASEQLVRQAHHLFEMYPHQEEVLLIAVAGFWWSYYVLPRNKSKIATAREIEEAETAEASTAPDLDETEVPLNVQDGVIDMVPGPTLTRDEWDPSLPHMYRGLEEVTFREPISGESKIHLIMVGSNFTLRADNWSEPILFDTPPSNQALYLIHQRLECIVTDGYNGAKG